MRWTQDEVSRTRELWALGHSATEISQQVPHTRNAVLGMLFRLGLMKMPDRPIRGPQQRRRRPRQPLADGSLPPVEVQQSPRMPFEPKNIPFLRLKDFHCREVVGVGKNGLALFCGHQKLETFSYCEFHKRWNYQAAKKIKKSTVDYFVRRDESVLLCEPKLVSEAA